jgi:hypothetical protein
MGQGAAFGATIVLAIPGSGSAEEHPTIAFGVGLKTCAWWRANQENSNQGSIWVEGYWSGRNQQRQHHSTAPPLGIWAMTANYCDHHPSDSLINAAAWAYQQVETSD